MWSITLEVLFSLGTEEGKTSLFSTFFMTVFLFNDDFLFLLLSFQAGSDVSVAVLGIEEDVQQESFNSFPIHTRLRAEIQLNKPFQHYTITCNKAIRHH